MATYADYNDVAAELGGLTLNATSTPSSTTVEGWIEDAEDEVEILSGQIYSTAAISSTVWEYHDYDGSGVIRLDNYPVQSVELVQYEENGLGADSASWVSLVGPGRTTTDNFILYGDVGAIKLIPNGTGNRPTVGRQNVRVAYTYGHTSVPRNVKQLVTKIAAKRYISSVANNASSTGGGAISVGAISISDPNNYVHNHLAKINDDIERLQNNIIGKFRVVNYRLELYD